MPLTPLKVAAINHLVARELSGGAVTNVEFAARMDVTVKTLEKWLSRYWTCAACGHRWYAQAEPKRCNKCGGGVTGGDPVEPEFYRVFHSSLKEARESTDLYALRTRQWALEELSNLYTKSKNPVQKRAILKDIMKQTEGVTQGGAVIDYSMLPESQLCEMALARNLTVSGVSEERLKELAKGA